MNREGGSRATPSPSAVPAMVSPLILAVTPNPAIDITYEVEQLRTGDLNRVSAVHRQAGGKGVNVARALCQLGSDVCVSGFLGGSEGARVERELVSMGAETCFVAVDGSTRCTITVIESGGGEPTEFSEPGPDTSREDWKKLESTFETQLRRAAVVTLSGSVPPGSPADSYQRLITLARRHDVPVVLDGSGSTFIEALQAEPDVVTPNRRELLAATGEQARSIEELFAAAAKLRESGARSVVVTLGRSGLIALTPEGAFRVTQPANKGNPVGAGDVLVAVIAIGLARRHRWREILREAAAAAAASVEQPFAGQLSPSRMHELTGLVKVRHISGVWN